MIFCYKCELYTPIPEIEGKFFVWLWCKLTAAADPGLLGFWWWVFMEGRSIITFGMLPFALQEEGARPLLFFWYEIIEEFTCTELLMMPGFIEGLVLVPSLWACWYSSPWWMLELSSYSRASSMMVVSWSGFEIISSPNFGPLVLWVPAELSYVCIKVFLAFHLFALSEFLGLSKCLDEDELLTFIPSY